MAELTAPQTMLRQNPATVHPRGFCPRPSKADLRPAPRKHPIAKPTAHNAAGVHILDRPLQHPERQKHVIPGRHGLDHSQDDQDKELD